jgi:RNA polymerase sigma-70 factor (ECF subfamily)
MELVYSTYREEFIGFSFKYGVSKDDALDIYQDAVIAMHQNFVTKSLELTTSSIKTYLFGIGKFKLFKALKARNKHLPFLEKNTKEEMIAHEQAAPNEMQKRLEQGLKHLSEGCIKVIRLFYYRNLTVEEIVLQTDYKDGNTVRSHKSRCMKKLKQLILNT